MHHRVDVAVVGAGIAGTMAAWWMAQAGARVALVEQELQPGLHATGRSAATISETSGSPVVCTLAANSRSFFERPPVGFAARPLAHPKPVLWIGRHDDGDALDRVASTGRALRPSVRRLEVDETRRRAPGLLVGAISGGGVYEPDAAGLDVPLLMESLLRGVRAGGGVVLTTAEVIFGNRRRGRWTLNLGGIRVEASSVVNAAGAWGDVVAERCGVARLGLTPLRRTVAIVEVPSDAEHDAANWPLVMDVAQRCYFEPVADGLLVSPADEHPSSPCDAQAEPSDVARAVTRLQEVTSVPIGSVKRSWAGLRTFTRDRLPAVGTDPTAEGFVWLVGQGGAGLKTAPLLGALAAAAAMGTPPPALSVTVPGVDLTTLDPARFQGRRPAMVSSTGS
jgi:D-arginine dehydrogenase